MLTLTQLKLCCPITHHMIVIDSIIVLGLCPPPLQSTSTNIDLLDIRILMYHCSSVSGQKYAQAHREGVLIRNLWTWLFP